MPVRNFVYSCFNSLSRTMTRIALICALVSLCGCKRSAPPYSPKETLKTLKSESGYRIEPFVSEPDVVSPVAMDVTQAIRSIYETARLESEINRRLRELIEYMGWKSGWETLQAHQHYFDPQRHAEVQDQLHQRMDQALKEDLAQSPSRHSVVTTPSRAVLQVENAGRSNHDGERDSDLEPLLALGGGRGISSDGE